MVATVSASRGRWTQLVFGVIAMIMVANLQYGWTLFVQPLQDAHGWSKTDIQYAFTLFVLFEVWLVPVNGWLVDRFGPKLFVAVGGVLVALGWVVAAHASTLAALYGGEIMGGIGTGIVYGTMVGSAVKWFPDKRGLAVGLTAAGFGAGAALTVVPISWTIAHQGYAAAFQWFGLVQGAIVVVIALFLRFPGADEALPVGQSAALLRQTARDSTPWQMLRTPHFYLLYAMFVMIATGLLFMTAQLAPLAKDYGVAKIPINFLGIVTSTLVFAVIVDNVLNGGSRVFFGWISDRIGRERTMTIAFALEALGLFGLLYVAHHPWLFVLCAGATFVASGEIYSLFPASCTDIFGRKFATTNCGLLYTAKGTAALVVPIASQIREASGSWATVISVLVAFNVLVALLALFVLKPIRERLLERERAVLVPDGTAAASAG